MGIHEHQCHHFFTWEPPQGFYASLLHHPKGVGTRGSGGGGRDKRVGIQEKKGWEVYRRRENRGQTGISR